MPRETNQPNYLIRPSKHIERKMFIETLQHLGKAGYNISDYHYLGFGSYYYVDFILFHNLLSIQKMTCLEKKISLETRMKFNKPFEFITLKMQSLTQFIPNINKDEKYLIWADYTEKLNENIIEDIQSLINTLKNGSVFILTVNSDLREFETDYLTNEQIEDVRDIQRDNLKEKIESSLKPHCGEVTIGDLKSQKLPELFARTISNAIDDSFSGRLDDKFYRLFNYVYQDDARMLTFGGIIDKKGKERDITKALEKLNYINRNIVPKKIYVPPLTSREKLFLDQNIKRGRVVNKFKIDKEDLKDYINYSKYYPTFYEVFIG